MEMRVPTPEESEKEKRSKIRLFLPGSLPASFYSDSLAIEFFGGVWIL